MDQALDSQVQPGASKLNRARIHAATRLLLPLILLLVLALLLGIGIGGVSIGPLQIIAILLRPLGIILPIDYKPQQEAVLWAIRLPRVLLAALVGSGLAMSGAALQGVFRNPLADPGLIGVSSGAALGAVSAIVLNISFFGLFSLPLVAFASGLGTALLVYLLARRGGRTEVVTLLLTGIALNAIAGAGIGLLTYLASDQQLRDITFWSLGSLGGATWASVGQIFPLILPGLFIVPYWGRALNILVLGEREARHLGIHTERVRLSLIALCALMTGAAVAVSGTIGFVGLVVPHLLRLLAGPDHRWLLPTSALGGAALLILADLLARTVVLPTELPLGVVTALVGGPFFLWLLYRTRREQGGWG